MEKTAAAGGARRTGELRRLALVQRGGEAVDVAGVGVEDGAPRPGLAAQDGAQELDVGPPGARPARRRRRARPAVRVPAEVDDVRLRERIGASKARAFRQQASNSGNQTRK